MNPGIAILVRLVLLQVFFGIATFRELGFAVTPSGYFRKKNKKTTKSIKSRMPLNRLKTCCFRGCPSAPSKARTAVALCRSPPPVPRGRTEPPPS